jgi:hypothetical protein
VILTPEVRFYLDSTQSGGRFAIWPWCVDAESCASRTQIERAPSRGKSEISAIFLAHLIAANPLIR